MRVSTDHCFVYHFPIPVLRQLFKGQRPLFWPIHITPSRQTSRYLISLIISSMLCIRHSTPLFWENSISLLSMSTHLTQGVYVYPILTVKAYLFFVQIQLNLSSIPHLQVRVLYSSRRCISIRSSSARNRCTLASARSMSCFVEKDGSEAFV